MKPFWRENQFTPEEIKLLEAVTEAHYASAFRQNPSTIALACAAQGSGDLCRSLAAALSTFGGQHGPLVESYDLLASPKSAREIVKGFIRTKRKVPGWGSSFAKGAIEDNWLPVYNILGEHFTDVHRRLDDFTESLHQNGHVIFPNPSALTAAAAMALGMPRNVVPYLMVVGRLTAWTEIFLNETKKGS